MMHISCVEVDAIFRNSTVTNALINTINTAFVLSYSLSYEYTIKYNTHSISIVKLWRDALKVASEEKLSSYSNFSQSQQNCTCLLEFKLILISISSKYFVRLQIYRWRTLVLNHWYDKSIRNT